MSGPQSGQSAAVAFGLLLLFVVSGFAVHRLNEVIRPGPTTPTTRFPASPTDNSVPAAREEPAPEERAAPDRPELMPPPRAQPVDAPPVDDRDEE